MPIKEIIVLGTGILAVMFVTNGPLQSKDGLRKMQVKIMREVGRTDNWGDPNIFKSSGKSRVHRAGKLPATQR